MLARLPRLPELPGRARAARADRRRRTLSSLGGLEVETTVERRGHCARAVASALHRCHGDWARGPRVSDAGSGAAGALGRLADDVSGRAAGKLAGLSGSAARERAVGDT